jgi:hypothetical protein
MGKQKGAPQNTPAIVALKRAGVEFRVHEYRLTAEEATYGESVAKSLGVAPQTISNWLHSTPLQMLKHTDAIRKGTGVDVVDLTTACLGQLRHIERRERANRLRGPKTPLNASEAVKSS